MHEHAERGTASLVKTYEILASDLQSNGVEAVFGLMSDDTALLVTALEAVGIRFYSARHENNAVVMAEGYSASSGRLGVAVIGRGPGAANCMNAVIHASRTGAPVLVVCGADPLSSGAPNAMGPDYKAFDIARLFSVAGLRTFVASSVGTARPALADAIAAARAGELVTLHLPTDVQFSTTENCAPTFAANFTKSAPLAAGRQSAVKAAAELLAKSRHPLILAGYGAYRAGAKDALVGLADRTGALLITSLRAKDLFLGSPFDLGIAGSFSHSTARRYVGEADCVLVVGASLNLLTSSFGDFLPPAPVVQVDVDRRHIGRYCYADVAVVGDARQVAEQLLEAVPDRSAADKPFHAEEVRRQIAGFHHSQDFQEAHTDWTVDPRSLAIELDKLLPLDRDVVFDLGNFFAVAPYIAVPNPGCLRYTGDFNSIGLGFGTAMGVAAAKRSRPTVLFIGDGSLFMTLGELETMAREDLPLIILVMNDNAYGAERHYLELRSQPLGKSVFPAFDFAPIAQACGIDAYTVRSIADLRNLADLLKTPEGPILIDCKINPAVAAPFMGEFARLDGHR